MTSLIEARGLLRAISSGLQNVRNEIHILGQYMEDSGINNGLTEDKINYCIELLDDIIHGERNKNSA